MPSVSDGNFLQHLYEGQDARSSSGWTALAVGAIALMTVFRLLLIQVPFERDEGGYAYIADHWRQGETPYRDALETKPPGVFAAYALILSFGRSVATFRAAGLLIALLTALLCWRLVHRAYGPRAGALATALATLLMVSPKYLGFTLNAEMVMMPFVLGAFLCLPLGGPRRGDWRYALGGLLLGAAVLIKPVALTEGLPVAGVILLADGSPGRKALRLTLVAAGFVAAFAACVAAFAAQGAAHEMLFWAFQYNLQYSTDLSFTARVGALLGRVLMRGLLVRDWPIWLAAVAGIVVLARSRQAVATRFFPLLWLVSSFLGTSASGRWTGHYFQQCLPAIALLAALGAERLLDRAHEHAAAPGTRRALGALLLGLLVLYPPAVEADLYLTGPSLARVIYGLNPFMEGEAVGRYLADHTAPDETVYVFGTEGQFLFHAGRRSATRFVFTYPLGSTHPRAFEWQRQAWDEIQRRQPRYVVTVNIGPSFYLTDQAPKWLQEQTRRLVATAYDREAAVLVIGPRETVFTVGPLPPSQQAPALVEIFRRR